MKTKEPLFRQRPWCLPYIVSFGLHVPLHQRQDGDALRLGCLELCVALKAPIVAFLCRSLSVERPDQNQTEEDTSVDERPNSALLTDTSVKVTESACQSAGLNHPPTSSRNSRQDRGKLPNLRHRLTLHYLWTSTYQQTPESVISPILKLLLLHGAMRRTTVYISG